MISEQDNSPEAVKGRVRSITKAIRYKARKEGGNMIKAFNDHMASAGSGIGAAERQMIKKSLGLTEKFSNWRSDLIEVMGEDDMEPKIKEKKIKNKIRINPEMSEEFEKIGGTVVEVLEVIDYDENYKPLEIETIDIIKPEPLKKAEVEVEEGYKEISFDKHQRMYSRYKKLSKAAMNDARNSGEASGDNRRKMAKMMPVIDKSSENLRKKQTKGELTGRGPRSEEADMSGAPSIKDAKPAKKTKVKYDPHMKVMAPQIEKEDADLEKMQKDADANRARAAKLKDRNVTRGSASFAAAKVADTVKKAAKYGPQQHKGTRTGVMRVEEVELDEYASMSPQEVMLQKKKAQLDVMIAKKRKQTISKAGRNTDEPTKNESVNEEESDAMKDKHLQRAGMGARADYKKPPKNVRSAAMSDAERQKSREASQRAFDFVKKSITDKYGKGAIMKTNKEENELDEKCWPGYRVNPKRKTKILFGKRYPNCEKAK